MQLYETRSYCICSSINYPEINNIIWIIWNGHNIGRETRIAVFVRGEFALILKRPFLSSISSDPFTAYLLSIYLPFSRSLGYSSFITGDRFFILFFLIYIQEPILISATMSFHLWPQHWSRIFVVFPFRIFRWNAIRDICDTSEK